MTKSVILHDMKENRKKSDIIYALLKIAASKESLEIKLQSMLQELVQTPTLSIERKGAVFMAIDGKLRLLAQYNFDPKLASRCREIRQGECLCGKAFASGKIVHRESLQEDHEITLTGMNPHGHLIYPLQENGEIIGVLNLYLPPNAKLSSSELKLVDSAASAFALVIHLERERMYQQIRKLEYQEVLNCAADGILSVDSEGFIRLANPAACSIFGYEEGELKGLPFDCLLTEKESSMLFLDGASVVVEGKRKDGQPVRIEVTSSCSEGEIKRTTIIVKDVTEREKYQSRLVRLRAAVEACLEGIFITDADARIIDCNDAFCEQTGYSKPEILGKYASILRPKHADKTFYEKIQEQLNSGHPWQGEMRIKTKSGKARIMQRSIAPVFDENGSIAAYVAVQNDITDIKRQREQMEYVQRLESLGVLAGGIAHDFNNLLASIMGNVSLARSKAATGQPIDRYLDRINTASRNAADLCQQMMAYAGQATERVRDIQINHIIREMEQLIGVSLSKQVELLMDLDENLPNMRGAPAQIRQVVLNLITNANEAIGKGKNGVINLNTCVRDISPEERGGLIGAPDLPEQSYISLSVEDNGCGMDEETIKKIFEPFYTTKFTGRGLGLSALLGIVRKHNGALKVESALGKGSKFEVLFPISSATQLSETIASSIWLESTGKSSPCVLVVDDDLFVREMIVEILSTYEMRVLGAKDCLEGLKKLQKNPVDLVVLDITMPHIDGIECMRRIREISPSLPIILCSGYSENNIESHVSPGKANAFICKPFQPEELISIVNDHLPRQPHEFE